MNKYLLSMVAVSALAAAAAPAHAQYGSRYPGYPDYADDYRSEEPARLLQRLTARLEESVRTGAIAGYEAAPLRADIQRLRDLEYRFGRDGLSRWERDELARRLDSLRGRIFAAERTRFGRSDGYDTDGNFDRGYDGSLDKSVVGPDDDWDGGSAYPESAYPEMDPGDDRWSDLPGADEVEPAWQDDEAEADGFDTAVPTDDGGRFDDEDDSGFDPVDPGDLGWDDAGADAGPALNVGDRAPAELGPVPDRYRGRYRDGSGVYYRYGRGTIYQIDAATHVIRWMGILPE